MASATATATEYILICDGCYFPTDGRYHVGNFATTTLCSRCGVREATDCVYLAANEPHLIPGQGPADVTTVVGLVLHPEFIWDTNRWYSDLGVDPHATRSELKRAYIERNGQASERLTYIIKQLLNPDVRRRYDGTPLGYFFRDYYIESLERQARVEYVASRINDGIFDAADFLDDEPLQVVDEEGDECQDSVSHPTSTVPRWSYYVRQTGSRDAWRLARWQGLLASALTEMEVKTKIAVGLAGFMEKPFEVVPVGYRIVAFLSTDEDPTEALAQAAASQVVSAVMTLP